MSSIHEAGGIQRDVAGTPEPQRGPDGLDDWFVDSYQALRKRLRPIWFLMIGLMLVAGLATVLVLASSRLSVSLGFQIAEQYRGSMILTMNYTILLITLLAAYMTVFGLQQLRPGAEMMGASGERDFHARTSRQMLRRALQLAWPILAGLLFLFIGMTLLSSYMGVTYAWPRELHYIALRTLEFMLIPFTAALLVLRYPRLALYLKAFIVSAVCMLGVVAASNIEHWFYSQAPKNYSAIMLWHNTGLFLAELLLITVLLLLYWQIRRMPPNFVEQLADRRNAD